MSKPVRSHHENRPWNATMKPRIQAFLCACLLAGSASASNHDYTLGALKIEHPYARPTVPAARTGAAYFKAIKNNGSTPDRLVSASTPRAERVELHTMRIDEQGVMRMRELANGMPLPPGREVAMAPGRGEHLMLINLRQPLKAGERFPLVLQFERAGKIQVEIVVESGTTSGAAHGEHAGHGGHKH